MKDANPEAVAAPKGGDPRAGYTVHCKTRLRRAVGVQPGNFLVNPGEAYTTQRRSRDKRSGFCAVERL